MNHDTQKASQDPTDMWARMARNIQALVEYACTVQKNSQLGGEPYVVVDVDGEVICTGPTIDSAMHWAVYKIETGEDVPNQD